jgi:YhgE/Pip-like protein
MAEPERPDTRPPARWSDPFRARSVWIPPLALVALLIVVMTLVYFGSVVNPTGHLRGLPVGLVDRDAGATVGGQRVDVGRQLSTGLVGAPAVSSRLGLQISTLAQSEQRMRLGKQYAAVVLPRDLTSSLLALAGIGRSRSKPTIALMTNPRAGTLAVGLATGVLGPALTQVSRRIGRELLAMDSAHGVTAPLPALVADPLTVATAPFRPVPSHSALGLSAFYIALLTTFCGFLGAVIVNTSIDAVLGYATTEFGPIWGQRQPVAISRWQTLLSKWAMALGLTVVLTGLMLFIAVVVLQMDAPHFASLWLLSWSAAAVIAIGTLVLFAALGTLGQLVALVLFVYLALASSGGTVPLDALSGFFRFVATFEPLRQILDGMRAILYFGARGDAGLTRAWIGTGAGLFLWLALGALVTTWYDRRRLYRMPPDLMAYVDRAVIAYRADKHRSDPAHRNSGALAPAREDARGHPPPQAPGSADGGD